MINKVLSAAFLLLTICASVESANAKVSLALGLYPTEQPQNMVRELRPCLDFIQRYLEDALGESVEIKTQVGRDYRTALNSIVSGQVDIARLGGVSYVSSKEKDPGIQILAMENIDGSVRFSGVIVVREDSEITDISQLRGKTFAFVSDTSTLGRYFPQAFMLESGIHSRDLKEYAYLGRHEDVGRAVWAGRYDAGALTQRMFQQLVAKGMNLRVIGRYENVSRAWVARSGLDPRVRDALREAFLRLDDPEIFRALGFNGFLPGDDSHYNKTRHIIKMNDRFFEE